MITVREVIEQLMKIPAEYCECPLILDGNDSENGKYVLLRYNGDITLVDNKRTTIERLPLKPEIPPSPAITRVAKPPVRVRGGGIQP